MITHDLRDVCVHEPVGVCRTEHMYGRPSGGHADLIRKENPLRPLLYFGCSVGDG